MNLLPESQARNYILIFCKIYSLQIIQVTSSETDHQEETPTGMLVLRKLAEMLPQLVDALSQDGDLNFRRASILGVYLKIVDNRLFFFLGQRHANKPLDCTFVPVNTCYLAIQSQSTNLST